MHGGNVYDQFTGLELSDATERHPDLLCFRLFPVSQVGDFEQVTPIHVDLAELQRLTGTVCSLQNRADIRTQGANFLSLDIESPQTLGVVYKAVRARLDNGLITPPAYVMEANRLGSMLFDADPESSVWFVTFGHFDPPCTLCIQAMSLERASFHVAPSNILAEVRGRWSGTIYLRTFRTPKGKPYVFLGRYRVLVESSSRLAQHLRELAASGRRMRLAETIAHLQEDEAGYTPEAISELL